MNDQVNIGIIGTSWWSDLVYLPIFQQYERASLIAICGRNRERADEMAKKYDIPNVYTDYRKLIQQADLDAVVIATPDDTHYEMVMAALDHKLHFICEKAVGRNAERVREMRNRADAMGVKHMVMYTWHWIPQLQQMKQRLDNGYTGDIHDGQFQWLSPRAFSADYNWRFDAGRSEGILANLGSHLIHTAMWLLGKVTAVTGRLGYHVPRDNTPNLANDSAQFILEFENGSHIQFLVSGVAHTFGGTDNQISLRLNGRKGSLLTQIDLSQTLQVTTKGQQTGSTNILNETVEVDFLQKYLSSEPVGPRLFIDCILDDKPCSPSMLDGYKVQQVIDAVIQSHQLGSRVEIDAPA